MWRIAEAENSQVVAELRQKIANLELENQEIVTLDQVDNLNSIEDLMNDEHSEDEEETRSSGGKDDRQESGDQQPDQKVLLRASFQQTEDDCEEQTLVMSQTRTTGILEEV